MSKKRSREDLHDNGSESLLLDSGVLDCKRVSKNDSLANSPSHRTVASELSGEVKSVSACLEQRRAVTCDTLLHAKGIVLGEEQLHSTGGTCPAFEDVEVSTHAPSITDPSHDSMIANHSQLQYLRWKPSRGVENFLGDDIQVDVDCFLEAGVEDLDHLAYNPTDVSQCHMRLEVAEFSDALFTGCLDAWGAALIPDGDCFPSDLDRDGLLWNEELDAEWMTAAVANLDRFNEIFDADASVLELLEASPVVE